MLRSWREPEFGSAPVLGPEDGRTPPPANPAFTEGLHSGGSGSGRLLPDERGSLLTLIRDPFYTRAAKVFGASRFQDGMTVLTGSGLPGNETAMVAAGGDSWQLASF